MDELLSIGRFSRLCGLSIGSLRHYHEVGLLEPADVDASNGFRRYSRSQLDDARAIAILRELELPLDDVRAVVAAAPAERISLLKAYRRRIESRIWRYQRVHYRLATPDRRRGEPHEPADRDRARSRDRAEARSRAVQRYVDAHRSREQEPEPGEDRCHDPHGARVGAPLAPGRRARELRPQRVAVLARLRRPGPRRTRALARAPLPRDLRAARDRRLGPRLRVRGAGARLGGRRRRERYLALARGAAEAIAEDEDRELLVADLASI